MRSRATSDLLLEDDDMGKNSCSKLSHLVMTVRSLKLLGGRGQSEVQKGTLLMMMKGHISLKRKRAPARQKGIFSTITGAAHHPLAASEFFFPEPFGICTVALLAAIY